MAVMGLCDEELVAAVNLSNTKMIMSHAHG